MSNLVCCIRSPGEVLDRINRILIQNSSKNLVNLENPVNLVNPVKEFPGRTNGYDEGPFALRCTLMKKTCKIPLLMG